LLIACSSIADCLSAVLLFFFFLSDVAHVFYRGYYFMSWPLWPSAGHSGHLLASYGLSGHLVGVVTAVVTPIFGAVLRPHIPSEPERFP
jgi:hypothetical protein